MRRLGSIAALAAAAAALCSAPATATPSPKVVTLADSGKTVRLVAGQRLYIRLKACPSCGFHWVTRRAPDKHVLRSLAPMTEGGCKAPCTGGNVTKVTRYAARAKGATSLRFEYLPPGRTKPAKTFRLSIKVA
jgi:predicted secreted protein